jgi:Fe-S cluster assembly scaffold protein SufB
MKSADKKSHYLQVDNRILNINSSKNIEVLNSKDAFKKYSWSRKFFSSRPKEGFFVWVKKEVDFPVQVCFIISSKEGKQDLKNLLVVEKGIKVDFYSICKSSSKNLSSIHKSQGTIILKEGASANFLNSHSWSKKDKLNSSYKYILNKNSKLSYLLNISSSPGIIKTDNNLNLFEKSKCDFEMKGVFNNSKGTIKDSAFLKGKDSSAKIQLRLVLKEKVSLKAISQIEADSPSKGHLDCQGLIIGNDSDISLEPNLVCKDKKAQLTHEASVGKISETQLSYLRTRGLSEKKALNLIINGFLKK